MNEFLAMGGYSPGPLDATVESRDESAEDWIVETVSFSAAYGADRVPAYLLLPKNVSPPFQVVIYGPPGSAFTHCSTIRSDCRISSRRTR